MDAGRTGGWALLLSAGAGAAAAVLAPRRWGRAGGAAAAVGLGILAARDLAMITSGALTRLRPVPRALLAAEPACACAAIALGARPWLESAAPASAPATVLAVTTFGIHAAREAIYLAPGQGRLAARPGEAACGASAGP
jgi:hypothetical protein